MQLQVASFASRENADRANTAEFAWPGRIGREPRGAGGFGYDPLFVVDDVARTAAELTADDKNRRSHRGQALRGLVAALAAQGQ